MCAKRVDSELVLSLAFDECTDCFLPNDMLASFAIHKKNDVSANFPQHGKPNSINQPKSSNHQQPKKELANYKRTGLEAFDVGTVVQFYPKAIGLLSYLIFTLLRNLKAVWFSF